MWNKLPVCIYWTLFNCNQTFSGDRTWCFGTVQSHILSVWTSMAMFMLRVTLLMKRKTKIAIKDYPDAACLFSVRKVRKPDFIQQSFKCDINQKLTGGCSLTVLGPLNSQELTLSSSEKRLVQVYHCIFLMWSHTCFPDTSACVSLCFTCEGCECCGINIYILWTLHSQRNGCAEECFEHPALSWDCYKVKYFYSPASVIRSLYFNPFGILLLPYFHYHSIRSKKKFSN